MTMAMKLTTENVTYLETQMLDELGFLEHEPYMEAVMPKDAFCSYGERRADDATD